MWAIIGAIFGVVINHFIIEPIEVRKIRKEYFEKTKKELLEKYKYLDEAKSGDDVSYDERQKMTNEEMNRIKYWICCPWCDNEKCVKGTDKCEAEIWAKSKRGEEEHEIGN